MTTLARGPQPDHGRTIGMSVVTLRADLETCARGIAELGFDGMEVHISHLGPGMPGVTVYEAHAAAAGELIQRHGLLVSTLNAAGDAVEDAVLQEFDRISTRGGVLGAMETQYQRSRIQEESLYYEELKHTGKLPIIGVNTFLNPKVLAGEYVRPEIELARANYAEKDEQQERLNSFKDRCKTTREGALADLAAAVLEERNIFAQLMHTVRHASLGEISELLYRVGGKYRRSM